MFTCRKCITYFGARIQQEQLDEKIETQDVLGKDVFREFVFQNVKEQMEVMQDKDTLVTRRNTNHTRLMEHLDHLVVSILLSQLFLSLDNDQCAPAFSVYSLYYSGLPLIRPFELTTTCSYFLL